MKIRATNTSAAMTGLYAGFLGLLLGPRVDAGSTAWLFVTSAALAGPAYFFVFGMRREDMVGLWVLQPALLKRVAFFFVGVMCICTVAQFIFFLKMVGR